MIGSPGVQRTYHLRCWTRFYAPPDEVGAYKTDPARLNDERKPVVSLKVDENALETALRGAGAELLEGKLAPLGLVPATPWPLHIAVGPEPWRIVEQSPNNPLFHSWEHVRTLEASSDGCRYMDAITFAPRLPATRLVARAVEELFIHIHKQSARHFRTDERATAVAMLRVVPEESERWQET